MTTLQAIAEARRCWGPDGNAWRSRDGLCVVGTGKKKFGEGPTYEAAFDVARAAEKHAGCQRG